MKAIILRAWEWSRLRPFSNTIPKPLIEIFWKSILEHNLENIYNSVDEIIIVVKYKKEEIINKLWDNFNWVKINYFIQWDDKWTAWALRWIDIKNSDILILNWDSIFSKSDLDKIINLKWYWALVKEVEDPSKYWIFSQDNFWFATKIIEKPSEFVWNLANLWVYKFDNSILEISNNISLSQRWEYEITDSINEFIKNNKFNLIPISWDFIDVWYPWDILWANKYFLDHLNESKIDWIVEDWVTIKGNIILAPWAILKSWTYIEWNIYIWENTSIWPNAYLRWSSVIWKNCHIWASVEIKNSSIWNKTNIAHLSYIWDSIIWNNINIGWWFISANLRHDNQNIKVPVKWVLTDTKLRKLWIIIWDNSKLWIKNYSYPWRVLENWSFTPPWEIIK